MAHLRWRVFERSKGRCENGLELGRCSEKIDWRGFEMHHIQSRGQGGSDIDSNCMALCYGCHFDTHNGTWKARMWDGIRTD